KIAKIGAQEDSGKAKTPPGRTNRDKERKTATGSGRYIRIKRLTTASNNRVLAICDTSDWGKVTLRTPASAKRTLARVIDRVSRSTPRTSPEGPTNRATSVAT